MSDLPVSDISNHPLIIRIWIILERFRFRFAEALKKDGDLFSIASPLGLYILRLYYLWKLVLVSWALNGSLRGVVLQARSGRIMARSSLVRKRNYLPASGTGTALLQTFLHTKVLLAWKFNPTGALHHGGSWERLVRSVKRVLYVILGSRRVTE